MNLMKKSSWRPFSKNSLTSAKLSSHPDYNSKAEMEFKRHAPLFFNDNVNFDDPNDPLLLQVLPQNNELIDHPEFKLDAVQDLDSNPVKGVIHKYKNRVLLISTGACAINCRYCFRRHFPYSSNYASSHHWKEALKYICENPSIEEVILSGGDPLMLSTEHLKALTDQLETIDHVTTLRIHTRMPTVAPQRITKRLLDWLKNIKLRKTMVLHCNHPNELPDSLASVLSDIKSTNTMLLNQSVLLKNINDDPNILKELSEKLYDHGVLPYYLNLLDKVKGTHHFHVNDDQARNIMKQLRSELPGYLTPRLVRDTGSNDCKQLIF